MSESYTSIADNTAAKCLAYHSADVDGALAA